MGDMAGAQGRNVAADQHHRSRRQHLERQLHALPEIARSLRSPSRSRNGAAPGRMAEAVIGRHEQPDRPAAIVRQPPDLVRQGRAIESRGRHQADLAGEPALDPAGLRRAGEDHEVALHHAQTVQAPDDRRRDAGREQGETRQVPHRPQQPSVLFVAPRRRDGVGLERDQAAAGRFGARRPRPPSRSEAESHRAVDRRPARSEVPDRHRAGRTFCIARLQAVPGDARADPANRIAVGNSRRARHSPRHP